VLGSGFLVGTAPHLIMLTATHVITEWADHVRPPPPHGLAGLHGDGENLRSRVGELLNKNLIRVVIHCRPPGTYRLCKIASLTITSNPREVDISCARLIRPRNSSPDDFDAFRIDVEPHAWDEPVLMAGFSGGSWGPPEIEDEPFRLEQSMRVRAGICRGVVQEAPGSRHPMYQVNMPSLPGMSGGPLLALRYPEGRPRIISSHPWIHATAIGIISRDCIAPPYLVDGSDPGETWAAPIEDAFLLRLAFSSTDTVYVADAVRDRRIASYGPRALTGTVFQLDEQSLGVRFGLPAD
jgi:hypothetical protein